jgi:hypothetical protein
MDQFKLHNIVNQQNMQCDNDTAYNVFSQTNNGYYNIMEDNKKPCECTYVDANSENVVCPAGQSVSTYYPLLNKAECCAPCDNVNVNSESKNLPSNYDHILNKLYPIHYDNAMFYDNPYFIDFQNQSQNQSHKLSSEQMPEITPEKVLNEIIPQIQVISESQKEIEHFANPNNGQMANPIIIEPVNANNCGAPIIKINLYYLMFLCILLLGIFGGIIMCRKKNIM